MCSAIKPQVPIHSQAPLNFLWAPSNIFNVIYKIIIGIPVARYPDQFPLINVIPQKNVLQKQSIVILVLFYIFEWHSFVEVLHKTLLKKNIMTLTCCRDVFTLQKSEPFINPLTSNLFFTYPKNSNFLSFLKHI